MREEEGVDPPPIETLLDGGGGGGHRGTGRKGGSDNSWSAPPPPRAVASSPLVKKAAAKKKKAAADEPALSPEAADLARSLRAELRKGPLECLELLCTHNGGETSIRFDPLVELFCALERRGLCRAKVTEDALVISTLDKAATPHMCSNPRGRSTNVMLHSIAWIRRFFTDSGFPVSAFSS